VSNSDLHISSELDVCELQCPMPLLKTKMALKNLNPGDILKVMAKDAGSSRDIPRYLEMSPHELLDTCESEGVFYFWIVRGN